MDWKVVLQIVEIVAFIVGGFVMAWVIEQITGYLPAWLKPFLTAEKIQVIVQGVFDNITKYVDLQVAQLDAKYDAWKNAKQAELDAEKQNAAALRAALDKQAAEHDEALSAEMIKRLNAEATVAQFQAAASQSAAKKTTKKA